MDTKDSESRVEQHDQQHYAVAMALDMPEILEHIFGYLVRHHPTDLINSALVCRKWRDAAYLPSLWRLQEAHLDLQPKDSVQLLPSLERRRVPKIVIADLHTHMRDLLPSLPSLKAFYFHPYIKRDGYVMTDRMLQGALQLPHTALTTFGLYACKQITDASVILLSNRLPNLKRLNLNWCVQVTDAGLEAVARSLPHLFSLYVDHCAITDAGVAALAGRRPEVASGTPLLSVLNLSGCGITDTALQHISCGFPRMRELLVSECVLLTDAGLGHLTSLGKLTFLKTNGCPGITANGLKRFPILNKRRCIPYVKTVAPDGTIKVMRVERNEKVPVVITLD